VKEIVLAVLGVLGVAIPSVIQLMTGESHRVSNMRATLELIAALPDDEEFRETKQALRNSVRREAKVDRDSSNHTAFMVAGAVIILACLGCSYLVMQTPGDNDQLHSLFILLAVVLYVVGAAVLVHGVHLLGRNLHLFSKSDPAAADAQH
jgi:quinol-cytochrome oxidoreductase complex cytochrome b subunit